MNTLITVDLRHLNTRSFDGDKLLNLVVERLFCFGERPRVATTGCYLPCRKRRNGHGIAYNKLLQEKP